MFSFPLPSTAASEVKSVLHIKTSTGGREGRKDRNDEGELKKIFSLHCYFAFQITTADKRGKGVSSTIVISSMVRYKADKTLLQ